MKLALAFTLAASTAIAAPTSKTVDRYFAEFEQCRLADGEISNVHCLAMKDAETLAKKEGCFPTGVGVDFRFERKDKSEC